MRELLAIITTPFVIAYRGTSLLLSSVAWGVKYSIRMQKGFKKWRQKVKPAHGDADFASDKVLKDGGHFDPEGWLVGVVERPGRILSFRKRRQRVFTARESCAIGMAARRTGKTQTAIAQLIELTGRRHKPDVLIVDPAGDIHAATKASYEAAGYRFIVINFVDPRGSETYDPYGYLRPHIVNDFDRQVDQLCQLVMPDDTNTREAHFQEFARILLAGTMAYLVKEKPEDATLFRTVELLTTDTKARNAMFSQMRSSPDPIVRQAVNAFEEAGNKEQGSFSTTMTRKLKVWLRQSVKSLTATGEIDANGDIVRGWTWEGIFSGSEPTVVYIRTGLGTDEGAAARLILGNAINTRRAMFNEGMTRFSRDLRILVDEAVTIGNCQAIIDATNELGKAGVRVMLWYLSSRDVFQTFTNAKTLINNSDILIFGGGKEMDAYEDFSRMIGEKTIENKGYSQSKQGESQSASEQARRVIKADELRRLPFYEMAAVLGNNSVKCQKPFTIGKDGVTYHTS